MREQTERLARNEVQFWSSGPPASDPVAQSAAPATVQQNGQGAVPTAKTIPAIQGIPNGRLLNLEQLRLAMGAGTGAATDLAVQKSALTIPGIAERLAEAQQRIDKVQSEFGALAENWQKAAESGKSWVLFRVSTPSSTAIGTGGTDPGAFGSPSTIAAHSVLGPTPSMTRTLPGSDQGKAVKASAISADGLPKISAQSVALLDCFKTNDNDFSQAVSIDRTNSDIRTATTKTKLPGHIGLTVKTASGIKVELALVDDSGTLKVQVTSSGTLSDDERSALANLFAAFEEAINGLTTDKPSIAIEGLTRFDPTVLASVELNAKIQATTGDIRTFSFHADDKSQSMELRLASGTIALSTDLTNPALLGNKQQHDKVIASYLQRFDAATYRGHGDANLAGLFKDSFVQMNGGYAPSSADTDLSTKVPNFDELNDQEHALLSGLADFQASLVQTVTFPNPKPSKRYSEPDHFTYQIAQQTAISEVKTWNTRERSITQTQESKLSASYHEPLKPGDPLFPPPIDGHPDPNEQSYFYYQIADQASSQANVVRRLIDAKPGNTGDQAESNYPIDLIVKADVKHAASQSTHTIEYDQDHLVKDITTPENNSRILNLLSLLAPTQDHPKKTPYERMQQQGILAAVNDKVFLVDDPAKI